MGLLRMAARTAVVAGTATAVSGRVARRQARKYDQPAEEEQYEDAPQQAPPPAPAPPQDESYAKLQELAQLHTQGVLSDDEFTAAKAKILGI
ncbi:MAG: SHOCT domain-containing protein [Mycobacterium sp.]